MYLVPETIYRKWQSLNIWAGYAILIVLFIATPVLTILFNLFKGPGEIWGHLASTVLWDYVINSFLLIFGVGGLSLVLGISSAWLVSTCQFPGRKLFEWALILPLSIPTYIMAYTYAGILDFAGPVQSLLRNSFGLILPGHYLDIMNVKGVIFIMSFVLYPYVYVIARSSFINQSRTILESSRVLGSSPWRTFFKVALPVTRPALVGGVSLVLMEVLNDYGAVKYYGVSTFTTGIFRAWFSFNDANAAIYLSALLMLFVFALIVIERLQRGGARFDQGGATNRPLRRYNLTKGKAALAFLTCMVPLFFGFIVPVMQLLSWAFKTAPKVVDFEFLAMVSNSFLLALTAAISAVIMATILIYAVKLNQNMLIRSLSKLAILGYSIPGAVIAVGVLIPLLALDKNLSSLLYNTLGINIGLLFSGTLFILAFAYVVRFMAVAYNPIDAGFKKICQNLDEVSRSLGISPFKTLTRVNIPLIKGAMLSGALLVFVDVLKELPLTLILRPFNFNTLATKAFELAGDELVPESSSAALIIIATGIIPIILLSKLISKNGK